jgi:hypothetical protein
MQYPSRSTKGVCQSRLSWGSCEGGTGVAAGSRALPKQVARQSVSGEERASNSGAGDQAASGEVCAPGWCTNEGPLSLQAAALISRARSQATGQIGWCQWQPAGQH